MVSAFLTVGFCPSETPSVNLRTIDRGYRIRIISARTLTRSEKRAYEETPK